MSRSLTILDLSITLSAPPSDAPPEVIASVILHYEKLGLTSIGGSLIDPLTNEERQNLRWYLEEYWQWPYEQFLQRGKQIEELLPEVGRRLYEAVFRSHEADRIVQKWLSQSGVQHQISIISTLPKVLSLPWELLHSEQGFLVLRTQNPVSIIRRLPQSELTTLSTSFKPPLRVLLVTARPEGMGFMDHRSTARELLDEAQGQGESGDITLEFLCPPTLATLRKRLMDKTRSIHILHFDGHGMFEEEITLQDGVRKGGGGQGKLAFEDKEGMVDLVQAGTLAQVLLDSKVRLVVLDACQSAMGSGDDVFSSVATRLIQSGVDAVVAMSDTLLVASAALYFEAFYRELAAGVPVPRAQERARQALHDDPRRHIPRRRRDDEGKPVELRDWWLPHYYQQRSLVLQPVRKPKSQQKTQVSNTPAPRWNEEDMPKEPRYGFSGRSHEMFQLERYLLWGKLVIIHGFGGIGKTALVAVREATQDLGHIGSPRAI